MSLKKRLAETSDRWKRFTRPKAGDEDRKEVSIDTPPPPEEPRATARPAPTGLPIAIPRAVFSTPAGRRAAKGAFGSPNGKKTVRRQLR